MGLSKNWIDYRTRIHSINRIKISDLMYLAGIFDGEGCITLGKTKNYTETYHLNVNITNTNKDLIDWVLFIVGKGGISRKPRKANWKQCYAWKINGELAVKFIKKIYPYLKVKKLQADVAIRYGETIRMKEKRIRLTDEERDLRRNMFLELRKINNRNNGVLDGYLN